jgi:hypothetical protein
MMFLLIEGRAAAFPHNLFSKIETSDWREALISPIVFHEAQPVAKTNIPI